MAAELSNLIINALPSELKSSLLARLQPVDLPVGTVLANPGQKPQFAHFMTSGIASVVTFMSDGVGAEVGVIGREGLVEAISILGPASAPTTAFIQSEGTALRMPFGRFAAALPRARARFLNAFWNVCSARASFSASSPPAMASTRSKNALPAGC